jgi:uncharacterized membrane protein
MTTMIVFTTLFPVVLLGCLLPLMGISRRGVLFGVTVPLEFAAGTEAKAAVRRYRTNARAVGLAAVVAVLVVFALGKPLNQTWMLPVATIVAIVAELVGGIVLWQGERRRMKAHAILVPLERTAELMPQRHTGGLWASAAAILPLAAEAVWLRAHWAMIPARWPQHWDAYGHVNGWGTRSGGGVFFPLVFGACIVALMTCVAGFIATAPGPQSKQRRLALAPLAGLSWVMAGTFCGIGLLPLRHNLSVGVIVALVVALVCATLGVVVWLAWRSGMANTGPSAAPYDGTPDAMWRGGLIYYNPGDAAVIVPKRYGLGWTLNFARPVAWAYIGGMVVVLVLLTVMPVLLRK